MYRRLTDPKPVVEMRPVGVVIDIGADAAKRIAPGNRYRYKQNVIFVVDGGAEIESSVRGMTKPSLSRRIESCRGDITARRMTADQWQDDDNLPHWSTAIHYSIG